jgi:membrane-associated phospholipid phosphatase
VFTEKLSSLDKGLATWAQSTSSYTESTYSFDTGLIAFINHDSYLTCIIALAVIGVIVIYDRFALKMTFSAHRAHYGYICVSIAAYMGLSITCVSILKVILSRPRPYQTLEFYPNFSTDLTCKVPFQLGYRIYTGENVCDYSMLSCPSGHTIGMATSCICAVYLSIYNWRATRHIQKAANKYAHIVFIFWSCTAAAILIPSVMIARISVLKHFFTDVTGSLSLAVCFSCIFVVLEPVHDDKP